jgi:hypothetical protein
VESRHVRTADELAAGGGVFWRVEIHQSEIYGILANKKAGLWPAILNR